jgi:hypothetical protein
MNAELIEKDLFLSFEPLPNGFWKVRGIVPLLIAMIIDSLKC